MAVVQTALADLIGTASAMAQDPQDLAVDTAVAVDHVPDRRHAPVVYFIQNGNRIKIGYTTNLSKRVHSFGLRLSNAVLVLSGGEGLESALHRRFDRYRVNNTEWFTECPEILSYMENRRQAGVQPLPDGPFLNQPQDGGTEDESSIRLKIPAPTGDLVSLPEIVSLPERPTTEEARELLYQEIVRLETSGQTDIGFKDLAELPTLTGRTRSWVYGELGRLESQGRLAQGAKGEPLYKIIPMPQL